MSVAACASALPLALVVVSARDASASCNLIPAARSEFPSTTGSVASPITAPGKTIQISVGPCDASAGFEPTASDNTVTLRFEPPGTGADTDIPVSLANDAPSDCVLPAGRCKTLAFTMPQNLPSLYPPYGLAGPARILVHDASNTLVAEIGQLFLPTTGCDRAQEQTFQQFTVLPHANNFSDAASGASTELLATLDGGGDLLIPFDYWGEGVKTVLAEDPGSPVARILDGAMNLDAFSSSPGVPIVAPSSDFIRSFTLDGRPLPPLLRSSATGDSLFGSADAAESVLRIARSMGGPDIYDLTDRFSSVGRGPIVITSFTVSVGTKAPLRGLRAGTDVVAFARDEEAEGDINLDGDASDRIVEIIDAQTGAQTTTNAEVVETQTANFVLPALDTEGAAVAFLELDPLFDNFKVAANAPNSLGRLQVRLADGTVKTSATIEGDPAPAIDGRPLKLSNNLVFQLQRSPSLGLDFQRSYALSGYAPGSAGISRGGNHFYGVRASPASVGVFERDLETGDFTLIQELHNNQGGVYGIANASSLGLTFDNRHIYVAGSIDDGLAVFVRDDTTGLLTFLEAHLDGVGGVDGLDGARFPATSFDGKNVYVCGGNEGKLAVFQRDTSTGALTFLEAHSEAGLAGCTLGLPTVDGEFLYAAAGLNTPSTGAVSGYSRDPVTGALTFVESHFDDSAGGSVPTLAQAVSAVLSADRKNVYVGALGDSAIAIFARNTLTGQLTYVGALVDGVGGVDGLGSVNGTFPDPDNVHMYALGPADNTFSVLDRDPLTGLLAVAEQYKQGVNGVSGLNFPTYGSVTPNFREFLISSSTEGALFRMPTLLRVFDAISGTLRVFPETPAKTASVSAGRAIVLTPEEEDPGVTNGDADGEDDIAQVYDGAANTVTSLGTAARSIAITPDLAAFTNAETNDLHVYPFTGGTVPPPSVAAADDGPIAAAGTNVVFTVGGSGARQLRIYEHVGGAIRDPQRVVDEFVVGNVLVAFRTPEGPDKDLNRDGDTSDSILQVYDFATRTVLSTGQAATLCTFAGCDPFTPYSVRGKTMAFVTREQDQGARDLNGDGDTTDTVMQVFDSTTRVLYIVDLSAGSPTLSPFPDTYGDGTISHIEANEADIGIDVDDDGSMDDVVVLLAADSDDDGVFDDADLCVEDPAEAGRDTDLDGIGDGCDPNPVCGAFLPAAPPVETSGAECQIAIGKALAKYVKLRSTASRKCLESLSQAKLSGVPGPLCLGAKAGAFATPPDEEKTVLKIAKAEAKLLAAVTTGCSSTLPVAVEACADTAQGTADCAAAVAAGAVESSLHQAYGALGASTPAAALKCQKGVGAATAKYLNAVVSAATGCLNAVADGTLVGDPRALCLGALEAGGVIDLPGDPATGTKISAATQALDAAIAKACPAGQLASLDVCGSTPAEAADCLACAAWRQAMEVVHTGYGPQSQ